MQKYSEDALLKVCYVMGAVIIAAIAGIAVCVNKVLEKIT